MNIYKILFAFYKSNEYEKLEQMVSKLEALRQHQAKRIAGLQSKTQRQSTLEVQKAQELSAAKSFLIENRQKHLRVRVHIILETR